MSPAMRAVKIVAAGPPSGLSATSTPVPTPGSDEVLVRVHAAGVNRSDALSCRGILPGPVPRTLGRDFAGEVVAGAPQWLGTRVWGAGGGDLGIGRDGTHAEFLLLPAAGVAHMPTALNFVQAAASGLAYFTAASAWALTGGVEHGMNVVVTGAGGGVGGAAACLAKRCGARVIGVVRASDRAATDPGPELDEVVISDDATVVEDIRSVVGGAGVARAIDTVGGALTADILQAVAPRAAVCLLSTPPEACVVGLDLLDFYRRELRLLGLNTSTLDVVDGARALDDLREGFEVGQLRPTATYATYGLDEVTRAYADAERAVDGRPILLPHHPERP